MKDPFAGIAAIYDRLHWGAGRAARKILSLADFKSTDEVLDLGGGTGRIAQFFIGKVRRVVVADPSEAMVAACLKKRLECLVASGDKLPFSEGVFDKVLVIDALHHIKNKNASLGEIRRVLIVGGNLIIEEFNPDNFWGKLVVLMEKIFKFDSEFLMPGAIKNLLDDHKFITEVYRDRRGIVYIIAKKY